MARKKPEIRIVSYGLYTPFDRTSRELPQVVEFTHDVPARVGVEFGYILNLRKARGATLGFRIEHPPFLDEDGQVVPPFDGIHRVRDSDYSFFLGDTLWEPIEDKIGDWTLSVTLGDERIASETFHVIPDPHAQQTDPPDYRPRPR